MSEGNRGKHRSFSLRTSWRTESHRRRGSRVTSVGESAHRHPRWSLLTDVLCVVAVAFACAFLPAGHDIAVAPAAVALLAYVLGLLIRFPAGRGYGTATQPAFVMLLFTMPLNLVAPVATGATLLVAVATGARRRTWQPLPLMVGDCWHVLPPTIVLALAAPGPMHASAWPIYVAAFSAQFVTELLTSAVRDRKPGELPRPWNGLLPVGLDALLTPAGVLIAGHAQPNPIAAAAVLAGLMGVFALVSIERRSRIAHEHRALHDPLTGLANRALFGAMLEAAHMRAERAGHGGAVLLADLNRFKKINDTYGHARGDQVLTAVAQRLTATVRRADVVARLGGDEFAILLVDQEQEPDAELVAQKLRDAFRRPLLLPDGGTVQVGVSVGVSRFDDADHADAVLARADGAMYEDKRRVA